MSIFTKKAHGFYQQKLSPTASNFGGAGEFVFVQKFSLPEYELAGPGINVDFDFAPTSPAIFVTSPASLPEPIQWPTNTLVGVEAPDAPVPVRSE